MECMCAQTGPRFILSSERVLESFLSFFRLSFSISVLLYPFYSTFKLHVTKYSETVSVNKPDAYAQATLAAEVSYVRCVNHHLVRSA